MEDIGLSKSWDRFFIDFTCCHDLLGVSHVSTLDHFFWSEQLEDNVVDAGVLHFPDNKSDHSPIYCIVSFPVIQKEACEPVQQRPRPNWSKANIDEKAKYKAILEERIGNLRIPASLTTCRDVKCRDPVHIEELDTFTMDLLETMQNVAEESLPMPSTGGSGSKQHKTVPGCGEAVKPYREEAYFLASGLDLIWPSTEQGNPQHDEKNQK